MDTELDRFAKLPDRAPDANKGDFGHALLIGGCRGMAGAISIAALGCLRSGAGLTTVATADVCLDTVAGFHPTLMTVPLFSDRRGRISDEALAKIFKLAERATVVGIGPGLGQSLGLQRLVCHLYRDLDKPLVVDADGLNALSKHAYWPELHFDAPRILTPHPGEFHRLSKIAARDRAAQIAKARELTANIPNLTIVLKGQHTFVSHAAEEHFNVSGNAKMAVGGSGDLLTGLIAGLICQRLSPFNAAKLGVHLHGVAGDLAAKQIAAPSVLATDIIDYLPQAFTTMK